MTEEYYHDYPNEPIGGDNPYYRCSYCKRSDPEINGYLERHEEWCEYRIKKTGGTGMTNKLPPKVGHIFRLAEIIREVDGSHSLGASALAEAILSHRDVKGMNFMIEELEDT
jgi:hypothetical protein